MIKEELLGLYAKFLMLDKHYTPSNAYDVCALLEEFLDTLEEHGGS